MTLDLPAPPELPDVHQLEGVTFLPIWANATDPSDDERPVLRVLSDDDTVHFSDLKHLALSGRQYLAALNEPRKVTSAMLLGTLVHFLVLGTQRTGAKPLMRFWGDARRGNAWEAFALEHEHAEILTAPEWDEAEVIAEAVRTDPVARARLDGARFEVPLTWEENGFRCATSGIDILHAGTVGDLKTTTTVHPETFQRLAIRMLYPQQIAWYLRGARANGLDVSAGGFVLGVETRPPYEVLDLELTEGMLEFADRTVSLWLEKLTVCIDACPAPRSYARWPGYAQSPVAWDVPPWMQPGEEEDA